MAKFRRFEGFTGSVPQTMIDENFPVCPFCHSNQPHCLLASKMTMTDTRTLYRCERCEATMSSSAINAAAANGKQFAFIPGAAAFNAARKGRKGQNVNETYFKIEALGHVCTNAALLGQELPMHELQTMADTAAPAAQPVQQPVVPAAPAEDKKPSLVMPILAISFAVFAWLLGYIANGGMALAAMVVLRVFLLIPSLIFGIIGLIKSLKGKKNLIGIILSACALLIALYLLINLFRLISIVSGGYGYFY